MNRTKLLTLLFLSWTIWADEATDLLTVDTLQGNPTHVGLSTVDKIEQEIVAGIKQKCDIYGCVLFVDEGNGNEFKITVGGGVGQNYSGYGGGGGGGINIYGAQSGNDPYYGVTFTYIHTNYKCIRRVPEGTYKLVESYQKLMSSKEYVEKVFSSWKKGEELPTPENVKTALSVLVSVKPSQGNCGRLGSN